MVKTNEVSQIFIILFWFVVLQSGLWFTIFEFVYLDMFNLSQYQHWFVVFRPRVADLTLARWSLGV